MQDLKEQIVACDIENEMLMGQQKELNGTLDVYKKSIAELFEKLDCGLQDHSTRIIDLGEGVNEGNMLDYLGIIEKRVNDVIQLHAYVMNKSENSYEMPQIIKGHREDSTASGSHANIPDDKHE